MSVPHFHDMDASAPTYETLAEGYASAEQAFDAATDAEGRAAAVEAWNSLRKEWGTWGSLVRLHFKQDTENDAAKLAQDAYDEMQPRLTDLDTRMMRKLVGSEARPELAARYGDHAFDVWDTHIRTYDPAIEQDVVRESKLKSEYTQLIASCKIEFEGEQLNLSGLRKYSEHQDRGLRERAERVKWAWMGEHGADLDRIYDELVKLRTSMAKKLGYADFLGLGYDRMQRTDYGPDDVARYRADVLEHVVPLSAKLRERQRERLGVDKLMCWDEACSDVKGNPAPDGGVEELSAIAARMFDEMGYGLGEFYGLMRERGLLDLDTRAGKAGGGFCTDFPRYEVPFIFANFNGTKGDVEVFTHEMGHAFQGYSARDRFPIDYGWPTSESAEIHSMSLEYLTWPWMDLFFGDDAARFRNLHLTDSLLFLPYGVAIDHFQHRVYAEPDASPADRHAMWLEMEKRYLPWRDNGGIERREAGAMWQMQLHVYQYPFYYIDYTLAQVCALQFKMRAEEDRAEAMDAYVALCKRGGEAPFQALVRGAGLESPLEGGCLERVVGDARRFLDV